MQLPEAYRSLSRPSSAPDAKAFALCSSSLELPIIVCSLELLEFHLNKIFCRIEKVFSFSCRYPPFGEIVMYFVRKNKMLLPFWKDSINFSILSSFICSFFQLILIQIFEFFRLPIRLSSFMCSCEVSLTRALPPVCSFFNCFTIARCFSN